MASIGSCLCPLTSEKGEDGEEEAVGDAKDLAQVGIIKEKEDDEKGVENQGPRHTRAHVAACIPHQPYSKTPAKG